MTQKEWEQLNDLLVKAADQPLTTWKEKQESMKLNLSASGLAALHEITSWGWGE